jgi:hypothetical protein
VESPALGDARAARNWNPGLQVRRDGSWLTMPDDQTTDHPAEGVNLPLPGIQTAHDIEDAEEHLLTGGAELESNELHASGRTCARCGQQLLPDEDVRRTVSGDYQHEFCQPR